MGFSDFFNNKSEVSTASTTDIRKELERRESHLNIFPLEIFNPKVKPLINELHVKYDIPRCYIGLAMMITYSTAIGTAYAVSRNGSDRMFLSTWGCFNGISSSGKSLALDMCLAPLKGIEEEMEIEWKDKTQGLTRDAIERLNIETVIVRDVHIPTMIKSIMPVNPKGILREHDEILEWINGLNALSKKEGTDEQFWLSAWDGRNYSAVRSGNQKISIPRVFANIIGGIQPSLLYKLFQNNRGESGFIFRVLFACPEEHKIACPEPGYDIPIEYKALHDSHVRRMYYDLKVESGYDDPKVCMMTKEATQMMVDWEQTKIKSINAITDVKEMNIHSGVLGKMKGYAYRFAGILAVSDLAFDMTDGDWYPNQLPITRSIMERALKAADYFYKSAIEIYESVNNTVTAPMDILYMATLFKMGKSLTQMADLILKDKTKKSMMNRMLKKAIKDYPKVFGAQNH